MMKLAELVIEGRASKPLPDASQIALHRLAPLVFAALPAAHPLRNDLRAAVVQAAAADFALATAATEMWCLTDGLDALVIKGAANGPLLYGDGTLRPREDVDVWLDGWAPARELAARLEDVGYRERHQLPGQHARHAIAMSRGPLEQIDVHAAPSRRVRVARSLPFSEAFRDRRAVDIAGVTVQTVAAAHAWFLGVMHLQAHHAGQQPPFVLLEDLRRLALQMTDEDWELTWWRASENGLLSALRAGLEIQADWSLDGLPEQLRQAVYSAPDDASSRFASDFQAVLDDLDLLDGLAAREYLLELLYPPTEYLQRHYGLGRSRARSILAADRLLRGVVARLAPRGHNREV